MKELNAYKAEIFSRMEKGIKERKRTRSRIFTCVTSLCLCLLIGLGVWQGGLLGRKPTVITDAPPSETGSGDNTNDNPQTNQGEAPKMEGGVQDVEIEPFGSGSALAYWEEKTVSISLLYALEKATDGEYLNIYLGSGVNEEDTSFLYEGKTLKGYRDAWDDKRLLLGRLGALLKMGDALKYGEALYITGGPDGVKWAKSLYEKTVEEIGQDLLDKYIIGGEFLSDKVNEDREKLTDEMRDAEAKFYEACDAYGKFRLAREYQRLKAQGINAGLSATGNTLMISVTKSEFENLKFDDVEYWFFAVQEDSKSEADELEQYASIS